MLNGDATRAIPANTSRNLEEPEEVALELGPLLVGERSPGQGLGPVGQGRLQPVDQLLLGHAVVGRHQDVGDAARFGQQDLLGELGGEGRVGPRAGAVGAGVAGGDPDDGHVDGIEVRIVVASPTSRSPSSADALSTRPRPATQAPSAICQGLISGSAIQFPAWVGRPLPPNGSPSDPTIWPIP